jgi:predicted transcriptional regulator of viral defense system
MAVNKKGLVVRPDTLDKIIVEVLSNAQSLTTDKIMQAVREIHLRKISRNHLNVKLYQLTKKGKIIRVQNGAGVFKQAIYKAKPHE